MGEDEQRVNEFYALLSTYPNLEPHLEWVDSTLTIADEAARIRARHRLRTPDALQAATALDTGATGLISNDPAFGRVEGFETLVPDQILSGPELQSG